MAVICRACVFITDSTHNAHYLLGFVTSKAGSEWGTGREGERGEKGGREGEKGRSERVTLRWGTEPSHNYRQQETIIPWVVRLSVSLCYANFCDLLSL